MTQHEQYSEHQTHNAITIHQSGHQTGRAGGWDALLAIVVIGAILLALAMVLVFGVIVLQMIGEMFAWLARGL